MRFRCRPVVLIAFEEFDNLGTGYLCSILSKNGYETNVIDFRYSNYQILELIKKLNPVIIGFSVIFDLYIDKFRKLAGLLRRGGIKCHFTAGGHYATLRYKELFDLIPSLDSIIRFDGEYTLLELTRCIISGNDWRKIRSIVYKDQDKIISNPLLPLEKDLDKYPFPVRFPLRDYAFGKKYAAVLAGRGCIYNCSYCCLREYYRLVPGPAKRIRSPQNVTREMELLVHEKECSVFLFQDDDFPIKAGRDSEWIKAFCEDLAQKKLSDKIMLKINCRPDEIREDIIEMMKCNGLFLIFIGIEDGTDAGLKRLNKHMTVAECLNGIEILKRSGIDFDYGFMLFQPSTTFGSVNENLDFLKLICSDGSTPVMFNKLMPCFATPVEKELRKEGRLLGTRGYLDYKFHEEAMDRYYSFIFECFSEWLNDPGGIVNLSRWARIYYSVYSRYYGLSPEISLINNRIRKAITESNKFILSTMKELASLFKISENGRAMKSTLEDVRRNISSHHEDYVEQIKRTVTDIIKIEEVKVS